MGVERVRWVRGRGRQKKHRQKYPVYNLPFAQIYISPPTEYLKEHSDKKRGMSGDLILY